MFCRAKKKSALVLYQTSGQRLPTNILQIETLEHLLTAMSRAE